MIQRHLSVLTILSLLVIPACDSGTPPPAKESAKADAVNPAEAERQRIIEEGKKRRAAEKAAEEAAEKAKQEKIATLAGIPEGTKMPKKLDKACDALGAATADFMMKHHKKAAPPTQTQMMVANCNKGGSIEVAVCQKLALEKATEDLKKDFPQILRACAEKYGGQAKDAAAK